MEQGQKLPVWETKTVQVYPSDYAEQKAVKLYEAGLWELQSSNRTQEKHGDTTSTFTRLTFRRNKNMPFYDEISSASRELENLQGKVGSSADLRKYRKLKTVFLILGALIVLIAVIAWFVFSISDTMSMGGGNDIRIWRTPLLIFIIGALPSFAVCIVFSVKAKKAETQADSDFQKRIDAAFAKMEEVRRKCGY